MSWTPPEPPDCFVRFMELLREHGEHRHFVLNDREYRLVDWSVDDSGYCVHLDRCGIRFKMKGEELAGYYFNGWRL